MLAFLDQATWVIGALAAGSAAKAGRAAKTLLRAKVVVARVRVSCLIVVVFL
jgi:hypothetical protein